MLSAYNFDPVLMFGDITFLGSGMMLSCSVVS